MSRLLMALLVFVSVMTQPQLLAQVPAQSQKLTDTQIAAMIEKQRRMVALDADGCERYTEEDVIVVCGRDEEKERQKTGDKTINNDRIRVGESYDATKAARCLPGDKICRIPLPPTWSTKFGKVPPIAIPLEEILRGLPEPDMIVSEGSTQPLAQTKP
jgi:hypothetical protein